MDTTFKVINKTININGYDDKINLFAFGDVHRDTKSCDVDRWKWFLNRAAKEDPEKTWYLGLGDYQDFASAREQKVLKGSGLHETTIEKFDAIVEREQRAFAQEIKQMRGRLLGLVHGNHAWTFENGKNTTEDLAERMGTEYLGWLCYLHLSINIMSSEGKKMCGVAVDIVACHGKAGGKLAGSSINQVEDLKRVFPLADIYIMGHDHARGAWPCSVLHYNYTEKKIKQKRQFLCRSGSFKKAYDEGTKGYEIGRLLRPADLGALKLVIGVHRNSRSKKNDSKEGLIVDISAEI